ncbi:MAG: phosphoribosylformylglycinamidine synthase subunit PurL, partial [Chloroflexi bacterium]|nr:phosphoribosylformylglycinamidine synthase subunit PurL [Chloroflexota bacterium]
FQGAATGVGGIVRDIFTMGARPVALLNSLRFGPLSLARNRYLFSRVVAGIGYYGNCLGVPTVGGEVWFDPSYTGNPLVNAMCVGLVASDGLVRAQTGDVGNVLLLVGADTGRDGILGASFASAELDSASEERRPAVQVGNPYLEKLLIEATLEIINQPYVAGVQDLGAAGLTSSVAEAAARSGRGAEIDVSKVTRRELGMTPYDVMLSESQERMLVVVKAGFEAEARRVFQRWDLHSDVVGRVTDDGYFRVRDGDEVVAEVPVELLTEAPTYTREGVRPAYLDELHAFDPASLPVIDPNEALLALLASPNVASKEWVYRQYDHMNLTSTLVEPGQGDAAVLRLKGHAGAIALTTDCNSRYCYLEPRRGGAIAVAEAARNLVCTGARPLALTNCLNFGNPEKPEVYYQLAEAIAGMSEAATALEIPVVSGNVSLYNETEGQAVHPTPVVGMVGLIRDAKQHCGLAFGQEGDVIALLGDLGGELGGSEYVSVLGGAAAGVPPRLDLDAERRLQRCVLAGIEADVVRSAHDCAEGGLAVALAECAMVGGLGARVDGLPVGESPAALLFGESQSRVVVTVAAGDWERLGELAGPHGVAVTRLGVVEGLRLLVGNWIDLSIDRLTSAWRGALPRLLGESDHARSA